MTRRFPSATSGFFDGNRIKAIGIGIGRRRIEQFKQQGGELLEQLEEEGIAAHETGEVDRIENDCTIKPYPVSWNKGDRPQNHHPHQEHESLKERSL